MRQAVSPGGEEEPQQIPPKPEWEFGCYRDFPPEQAPVDYWNGKCREPETVPLLPCRFLESMTIFQRLYVLPALQAKFEKRKELTTQYPDPHHQPCWASDTALLIHLQGKIHIWQVILNTPHFPPAMEVFPEKDRKARLEAWIQGLQERNEVVRSDISAWVKSKPPLPPLLVPVLLCLVPEPSSEDDSRHLQPLGNNDHSLSSSETANRKLFNALELISRFLPRLESGGPVLRFQLLRSLIVDTSGLLKRSGCQGSGDLEPSGWQETCREVSAVYTFLVHWLEKLFKLSQLPLCVQNQERQLHVLRELQIRSQILRDDFPKALCRDTNWPEFGLEYLASLEDISAELIKMADQLAKAGKEQIPDPVPNDADEIANYRFPSGR